MASPQSAQADTGPKRVAQRKRKPDYLFAKLALAWVAVLALIVVGVRLIWKGDEVLESEKPSTVAKHDQNRSQDAEIIDSARNSAGKTINGFLSATGPEQRNQYVFASAKTASRMVRFYQLNPAGKVTPGDLISKGISVIHAPGIKAIDAEWSLSDGRVLDTAFIEENGEWRLDWDHYVRYSEYPWPLFLSGDGEPEGEFRLLARERLADERKNADTISMILYAPRFGYGDTTGLQSPEFNVRRASEDGKMLDAAFKLQREGKRPFAMKASEDNKDDLIRVRVRVRRADDGESRHFEITKVLAPHWYSIDATGLEEEKPSPPQE